MKQHLFSFFKAVVSAACVSIFIAGCTANNPDSLGDGDDTIDVVTIESLNIQVKDINKSLNEYKTTMNLLSSYVVELQNKVNALDGQGYTDLKSKVDALDGKVTAFESALKNLDGFTDLNSWVNNLNNGLNSLNTLQGAVNEAKTSIANITTRLNGLDQTTANIASELNTKTKQLTDDLSKCSTDISGMMDRLAALENSVGTLQQEIAALISAVQSVVVIPDYADGSVKMTDGQNNVLRFEVYPATAAQKLAEVGPSAFSLDCVETETRSSIFTNIPIIAVSFDGEVLSVTADGSGLKDSIKDGTQSANARLRITDGKVTRSSEYFALCFKSSTGKPILRWDESTNAIVSNPYLAETIIIAIKSDTPILKDTPVKLSITSLIPGEDLLLNGTAQTECVIPAGQSSVDVTLKVVFKDISGYFKQGALSISASDDYLVSGSSGTLNIQLSDPVVDFSNFLQSAALQSGEGYQVRQAFKTRENTWDGSTTVDLGVSSTGSNYLRNYRNMYDHPSFCCRANSATSQLLRMSELFPNYLYPKPTTILDYGNDQGHRQFSPADSVFRFVPTPGQTLKGVIRVHKHRTFLAYIGSYAGWLDKSSGESAWVRDSRATGGDIAVSTHAAITGFITLELVKVEGTFDFTNSDEPVVLSAWFYSSSDQFMTGFDTEKYDVVQENGLWKVQYKLWPR